MDAEEVCVDSNPEDDSKASGENSIPNKNGDLIQLSSVESLSKTETDVFVDEEEKDNASNVLSSFDDKSNKNILFPTMNITVEETSNQQDELMSESMEAPKHSEAKEDPRITPKLDCQEKIIFCIDLSSEMNDHPFKLGNGGQFSPLSMVKRVIEIFVHSKLAINSKHEFAVVGFFDIAIWFQGFTSDPKEIIDALDALNEVRTCQKSALSSIFTIVSVFASQQPFFFKPDVILPHYALRVILIYGRSNCIPESLKNIDMLQTLKASPYFFLDILYIHESPSTENKCQEIFERLCDLDENDTSYIFEVSRNTTKLHNCMARLLAHPLQRPLQKSTHYKL